MGFRTVVSLNNDHDWMKDPNLGMKIWTKANSLGREDHYTDSHINVIECTHADNASLISISFYGAHHKLLATDGMWNDREDRDLRLLKEAADSLGYRLVKKSQ